MYKKIVFLLCLLTTAICNAQYVETATNGLYYNPTSGTGARVVGLGGALTQNTTIDVGSSYNLSLNKGGASYLSILNNGNIGIGVSNPGYSLHLPATGKIAFGTPEQDWTNGALITSNQIKFRGSDNYFVSLRAAPGSYILESLNAHDNSLAGLRCSSIIADAISSQQGYIVAQVFNGQLSVGGQPSYSSVPMAIKENGISAEAFPALVLDASKSPGIGNTIPLSIHIKPRISVNHSRMGISFGGNAMVPNYDYSNFNEAAIYVDADATYGTTMHLATSGSYTAGAQARLSINPAGNIGIGTTAPNVNAKLDVNGNIFSSGKLVIGTTDAGQYANYALAVNGNAIFNKVKVKLYGNWPDYVFEEGYQLPSLKELSAFIKQHKHLPGLPQASEVEKNGIDVGDNSALLLKKIEELTLYMIDLNKREEALSQKVDELSKENKELREKLQPGNK